MTAHVTLPDGASLAVRDPGTPLPALIWGHGLSSSMASEDDLGLIDWSEAAPGHRVVRYDARGHGDSDSTPDLDAYRWDRLAVDQIALADQLCIDTFVAGGASMGCATALFAALAAPDRVRALVLVIPPTGWETRRAQVDTYSTMADLLDAGRVDVLVNGVSVSPTPDPFCGDDTWKDRTRRTLRAADPSRLGRVFRGAGLADLPDRSSLATIGCPTLVLGWSGDPGHPESTAEELERILPNVQRHLASTRADLAAWTSIVRSFLDEVGDVGPTG